MKNGALDAKGEEGGEVQHSKNENRVGKNLKLFFKKKREFNSFSYLVDAKRRHDTEK